MQFGTVLATACSTFALTNIDDVFVPVTFFAGASTRRTLTRLKITTRQYVGFTVVMVVKMIGLGASLVLPSEPIGFLGLLPALLGIWKGFGLLFPRAEDEDEAAGESKSRGIRGVFTVAAETVMKGGDNVGTYVSPFSQTKGAEIAVVLEGIRPNMITFIVVYVYFALADVLDVGF
ncbi:hypothetical protein Cob_v008546 [Colletotrichum orbiculare MAFF 240422]|uniref:Uncharacterized protein n=1 Tax=Colletotrichum orbiculare (strain 104-T / ATCC 96160 / CBS 514.97 / LARS 414 / MAFF 240422) TaxID=1213857 RepID=N4V0R1_COLOR|nr:hypothetical protein Cob_v008546 [Colletotrichum orbiculare MAFF 240422]